MHWSLTWKGQGASVLGTAPSGAPRQQNPVRLSLWLCSLCADFILTLRFNKLANHLVLEVGGKETLSLPSRSGASPRVGSDWITVGHVAAFQQIPDWPGLGYRVNPNPSLSLGGIVYSDGPGLGQIFI